MLSFTPEEIEAIMRITEAVRQYPHLRLAFIRALQMEELFTIPDQLESLKQVVMELAAQYKQQQAQLDRIEQTANRALEVAERTQQTSERALQLAERAQQTSERALQLAERAQQTSERALQVATETKQIAERAQQTSERALQVATEAREIVNNLQKRLARVEVDVADLKGMSMELMARKLLPGVLGKLVRKIRVYEPDEFYRVVEDAGQLSADDLAEVVSADVFVHGHLRSNDEPRWFVVEASWGLGTSDVEHAARRASILTQHFAPAIGTVLGRRIAADARKRAQELGVLVVLNGAPRNPQVAT
jgi:multidrug efflux pump subunit AcrA (membrane-fusion protein)